MSTPAPDQAELWQQVLRVYDAAQVSGAASKTDTQEEYYLDTNLGVEYVLRIVTALNAKPQGLPAGASTAAPTPPQQQQQQQQPGAPAGSGSGAPPAWRNPFLPPDPELFVCHLPPGHSLVLNKFNVVAHHLLVITQDFQSQADPLYAADLAATWSVLQAMPNGGVAFYNCGPASGRSQPHKHLQIVPLPFAPGRQLAMPMQPVIDAAASAAGAAPLQPFAVKQLPYRCFAAKMPASPSPQQLEEAFSALLAVCRPHRPEGSSSDGAGDAPQAQQQQPQQLSYNVLLSRDCLMVVPRSRERVGPCAFNSLAFAGTALVRSDEELEFVRNTGPTNILAQAGVPW